MQPRQRSSRLLLWSACLAILASASVTLAAPVKDDVYTQATPATVVFGNTALELRLDRATGELREIAYRPKPLVVLDNRQGQAGADLNLKGAWVSGTGASPWRYESHGVEALADGGALHVVSSLKGWRLESTYRLWPKRAALERHAVFTPGEGMTGRVDGLRLSLPGLKLGDPATTVYAQLSNYPPVTTAFPALQPGRVVGEENPSVSGHFVLLQDRQARIAVPVTFFSDQEYGTAQVVEGQGSITVIGHQWATCDVQPGKAIGFGSQLLGVTEGYTWHDGLEAGQKLYDLIGLHPPARTRELAAKTVMYSAHPGGTIDSGFRDVGGYRDFAKLLPHLHDLGVNTLWLLPIFHGYVYAPDDYYALDPRLGTEADLKALVDQAHALGIRVLLDLIPHGPLDRSKLHEQHPDWICKNQDGSFQYWWGCLYCDYAHPGWQQYMADHAADWVKRVGVDGYRVDCAGGGPPNWRPYDANRPTMSGLYGGLRVLAAARAKMETLKPDIFLLAEAGGPPFFESANFTYNWAFAFRVGDALSREGAAVWVPRASEWLERQRYSFPAGARQIMCLENHDTTRALLRFGVGTQRALLALSALSDATPFLYHDEEIGYGPYLKKLYALRAAHDELTLGEASYTAISSDDPEVLTILRTYQGRQTVVAINFGAEEKTAKLNLCRCSEADRKARYFLWDAFAERAVLPDAPKGVEGEDLTDVPVVLGAYSPAVILIRPAPHPAPAAESLATGPTGRKPTVKREGNRVTVNNGLYEVRIGPEAGGLIESLATTGPNAHPLLGPVTFGSLQRRLWLGGDVKLGPDTLRGVEVAEHGYEVEVVSQGLVSRTIGGQQRPALAYEVRYVIGVGFDLKMTMHLTPQMNVAGVLGSLATTFAFPGATRWSANTLEGLLYDDLVPRRSTDEPFPSLYAHPHSDRLFASQVIPLDPDRGFIGAEWPDGTFLLVRQIRGWAGDVPRYVMLKERLRDDLGLHAVLAWADGSRPLVLEKGRTYDLAQTFEMGCGGEPEVERAAHRAPDIGPIRFHAEGNRYVVETPLYRAALGRAAGGSLDELALRGATRPALAGSSIYSDYGIYPDWTDPSGNKAKTNANSHEDPEPEVGIDRQGDRLQLTFSGRLRQPNTFGRGVASPPLEYRVSYGFSTGPTVAVECAVRPNVARAQVKAFLAQTLSLPGAGAWVIYTGQTPQPAASGRPPGPGDRVWQSLGQHVGEGDRPRLLVELPGPVCADFSDFVGLKDVQNLFYLQGRDDSVLFAAFLDGQPEDLHPAWRTVKYRIALHAGALAEVLKQLGLPAPKGG